MFFFEATIAVFPRGRSGGQRNVTPRLLRSLENFQIGNVTCRQRNTVILGEGKDKMYSAVNVKVFLERITLE